MSELVISLMLMCQTFHANFPLSIQNCGKCAIENKHEGIDNIVKKCGMKQ